MPHSDTDIVVESKFQPSFGRHEPRGTADLFLEDRSDPRTLGRMTEDPPVPCFKVLRTRLPLDNVIRASSLPEKLNPVRYSVADESGVYPHLSNFRHCPLQKWDQRLLGVLGTGQQSARDQLSFVGDR